MYVYVQKNPNWICYSYGGLFRLGYYILNLRIFESSRIISRWGCAPVSIILPDSATTMLEGRVVLLLLFSILMHAYSVTN